MRGVLLLCAGALIVGCGGGSNAPDASTPFLAFGKDFQGYRSWRPFDTTDGGASAGIHDGAQVTEYLNHAPPSGSTTFPVGTIVVKEVAGLQADGGVHPVLAMAKRGGGYNAIAKGWEWFELQPLDGGTIQIVWRGVGPPVGDTYGGDATAGCNTCHSGCGNDAVCARPLALTNF